MPLYEYQCDACSHRFERIQKFSDPPIETCPACSGAVRKLISSPAIQFKGSGWYITDYAKKPAGDGKSSGDGGKPAASTGTSPTSDTATSSSTGNSSSSPSTGSSTSGSSGSGSSA